MKTIRQNLAESAWKKNAQPRKSMWLYKLIPINFALMIPMMSTEGPQSYEKLRKRKSGEEPLKKRWIQSKRIRHGTWWNTNYSKARKQQVANGCKKQSINQMEQ